MKKLAFVAVVALMATGCTAKLTTARLAVDTATAVARKVDVEVIYQADIERKRIRALRCMNPMLTPDALATVYTDPRMGEAWMAEFLNDCPQFAGLLGAMAQHRLNLMIKEGRSSGSR